MRFNGPAFGEWMDSASMFARAPQLVRLTPSLVSPASAKIQNPPSLRAINGVVSPLKGIGFYDYRFLIMCFQTCCFEREFIPPPLFSFHRPVNQRISIRENTKIWTRSRRSPKKLGRKIGRENREGTNGEERWRSGERSDEFLGKR